MIDQTTIQKIIDTAEIVDVIKDFVSLKKRGISYIGLCPFHNEKTPSFSVSQTKGIFKCFGCQKGGNAVNFIMEVEQLSYPDALKYLAKKYNIEIADKEETAEEIQQRNERESMLVITEYAQKNFTEILHNDREGKAVGYAYFKERGFTDLIIKKFELGYCSEQKDSFTRKALKAGFNLNYLVKTGLTISKDNSVFDRFNHRVIFPIHSLSGKVIGFGGRVLRSDQSKAKYLNSIDSEIYHKSDVLYGAFFAKKSISQNDKCFLVEGYTDVISLHQAGIENVVASSGTALTVNQIRLIKRFTKNLTILYDGDSAGIKASLRGIDLVLEEGMNVKVVLLPDNEDPDSVSRKLNSSELHQLIKNSEKDFITFKTQLLMSEANDPIRKANLITDIVRSISIIPDAINRTVYIRECSKILKVEEQILYWEINKLRSKKDDTTKQSFSEKVKRPKISNVNFGPTDNIGELYELEIIRVLINYGNEKFILPDDDNQISVSEFIIGELEEDYEHLKFENPIYIKIFEEIRELFYNLGHIDQKYFINHIDLTISKLSADLLSNPNHLSKFWERGESYIDLKEIVIEKAVPKLTLEYKDKKVNAILSQLKEQLKEISNLDEQNQIIQRYMILKQINVELSKRLGYRTII